MKKTLCMLMAALMVAGMFSSCAKQTDHPENEDRTGKSTAEVPESETGPQLEIPDTRYDGKELVFLTRDEGEWSTIEIVAEKTNSKTDNVSAAVFERNTIILDKYGVEIKEIKRNIWDHPSDLSKEVKSPTGEFTAVTTNTPTAANASTQGYIWDLNSDDITCIDLQKPWWDTNLAKGLSIGHHIFFGTGDILTLDNDATFAILFNKELAKNCQLPDLYGEVENHTWTMDRFYEFEKAATHDVDGNGKLDYKTEVCGYGYTVDSPNCLMYANDLLVTSKDENDYPVYNLDVERADNVAEKCQKVFSKDYSIHLNNAGSDIVETGKICFGEGHALFLGECMQCITRMRGYAVEFGILPFPLFDKQQKDYRSIMHLTGSVVSIPKSVAKNTKVPLEMVDAMLEAMAYYSVGTLTMQYYDINLKTRDAKDEQSGPMIDAILANRVFDLAYYYAWGGVVNQVSQCFFPNSRKSVSSSSARLKSSCEKGIRQTISRIEKLG